MIDHPSKHDLVTAYERCCPRAAYESMMDDSPPDLALQARFTEGNVVDKLAQESIFSEGTTVKNVRTEEASGVTSDLMTDPSIGRINQATVTTPNGETARLDSIERSDRSWNHDEVKSAGSAHQKYEFDALISTDRARRAGVEIDRVRLVHTNKDWRLGDPNSDLFTTVDITDRIEDPQMVNFLSKVYESLEDEGVPSAVLVKGCKGCPYFSNCFGETDNPITELSYLDDARMAALSQIGAVDIRDIPEGFDLTNGQRTYIGFILNGQEQVNMDMLRERLGRIESPVRHLDFESVQFAVPMHVGVAPWRQVATQYSIHVETDDGLLHLEHLSEVEGDGRRELAERLIEDLGDDGGTIVAWGSGFEEARIGEMAEWFPDLAPQLISIRERMLDLLSVVKATIRNPEFRNSYSLKVVAPVLVPGFGYSDLDIAGGGDAQGAMNLMMRGRKAAEVPVLRERLLRYCERDTEATVRILRALREKVADYGGVGIHD